MHENICVGYEGRKHFLKSMLGMADASSRHTNRKIDYIFTNTQPARGKALQQLLTLIFEITNK
jgi:hypothetical protein